MFVILRDILLVSGGAVLGAILRYLIISINLQLFTKEWNIVLVNLLGCFLAGLFIDQIESVHFRALIMIGFLGSLTTFSTFIIDLDRLWSTAHWTAIFYLLISVIGGMALFLLARSLMR